MKKPKTCYECMHFCPDTNNLKSNGECLRFGYFVNGRNDACKFGELKSELIKT